MGRGRLRDQMIVRSGYDLMMSEVSVLISFRAYSEYKGVGLEWVLAGEPSRTAFA